LGTGFSDRNEYRAALSVALGKRNRAMHGRPMITALFLSLGQLFDPRILRVLLKSLLLTVVVFVLLGSGLWWIAGQAMEEYLGWSNGGLAAGVALVATALAAWILFGAVAIGVMSLFADEVIRAVEARHYPAALADARNVGIARASAMGLASSARLLLLNVVLSPLYLLLLVTGIGPAILFVIANGWLLGRDLGDMVAARHMGWSAMRGWRGTSRGWRFVLGVAAAALIVVPVINLLVPVLGAAMATHLFHRGRTI
jgi:uncharacterized protein involved in cysteine biosynthesis